MLYIMFIHNVFTGDAEQSLWHKSYILQDCPLTLFGQFWYSWWRDDTPWGPVWSRLSRMVIFLNVGFLEKLLLSFVFGGSTC